MHGSESTASPQSKAGTNCPLPWSVVHLGLVGDRSGHAAIVEILGHHQATQIRKQQLSHEEESNARGTNFRGDDASQVPSPPADQID